MIKLEGHRLAAKTDEPVPNPVLHFVNPQAEDATRDALNRRAHFPGYSGYQVDVQLHGVMISVPGPRFEDEEDDTPEVSWNPDAWKGTQDEEDDKTWLYFVAFVPLHTLACVEYREERG